MRLPSCWFLFLEVMAGERGDRPLSFFVAMGSPVSGANHSCPGGLSIVLSNNILQGLGESRSLLLLVNRDDSR